ncbi:molybdopterin-dependent oxidoreductase [Kitasatospora cineracea]|uniref:DMSO/TMAO reductase YedYZ molybdopterin-dependent catalytic subunit n=1 Tax=Kitasatospora cineracea TaxID=88074 RepID=A0A8G1USD7_9ACTN|nr:molybdopterin-dependent oxidoreductase [Kitasatospora cineracea]ROR46967.1 DMSO/TMAO reductase YedYZ molybdopterin-dependent catalytic subunit [Kitasatospora cineracea]
MTDEPTPPAAAPGRRHRVLRAAGAAAIGLASAVAALGAGELVAYATGAPTAPVIAVGSAAIDLTPTPLKEYAVRTFGTHDKPVLLGGIYLTMALLAALAGLLAVRRPAAGAAVFGVFGALGAWAALSRPGAAAADCAPSIVAGLVGATAVLLLARLYRRALSTAAAPRPGAAEGEGPEKAAEGPEGAGPEVPPQPVGLTGRRTVLAATAGTFAVGALAGVGGRVLTDRRFDVTAARDAVRLPAPAEPLPPLPAAVHPRVPGLSPFTTPNADFYRVDTALTLPRIDPRDWALRIHGLVDRPQVITFDELLREPLEELDYTLSCVSNEVGGPYVGTSRWLGAPLPALLRRAGVRAGADQLVGRSKDGMTIGTPLESVLDGRRALLALAMNGEALPLAHGFPCRSLVPGFYGYTSATKWLIDLEVTAFAAFDPYWVRRGWDRTGTVRTASRIEVPAPFAKVPAGEVDVAGTAWATHRGVAAVEVRVDGGPWQPAELAADAGPDLWRQWSYRWPGAAPGTHRIEVRATDATGAVQPEQRATPFPAGATGWHSTVVTVT